MPVPQTAKQREVEARLKELSDRLARQQGLSRRRFFQTASGMAASFVAMNQVFGRLFEVSDGRGGDTGHGGRARAGAVEAVHHRRPHPFSARRHAADGLHQGARGGRQGRLEQGDRRQGTDHRRSQIRQLHQRNLHGQRHQGGAAVEFAVGGSRGLVHPAGAGVQDPRAGQQGGRHAADDGAFHDHPGLARLARPGRQGDRGLQARFHGRATRSATTPTRSSPTIPSISTTRS